MTTETCADCQQPAAVDAYAGRWCRLGEWVAICTGLCDDCAYRAAQERIEKRAS